MPEGDTIYRAAGQLRQALQGDRVETFRTRVPQIRSLHPDRLVGQTVTDVASRGKHLLIWFAPSELCLHTHLGMNGVWHVYASGEPWRRPSARASVVLETGDAVAVCFGPGACELLTARQVEHHRVLAQLGTDLLAADLDVPDAAARILSRRDQPIAEVLLDQRVVAGLGNVYKSEVLFIHGVNPWAPVASVSAETIHAMVHTAVSLLRRNAASPGERRTTTGIRAPALQVYGRVRRGCLRCDAPIRVADQGEQGRLTYWCARCQPGH